MFTDQHSGVAFPKGFEIFRGYKDRKYQATAVEGGWLLVGTSDVYASLDKLNRAIGVGPENAWTGWHYRDAHGRRRVLDELSQSANLTVFLPNCTRMGPIGFSMSPVAIK